MSLTAEGKAMANLRNKGQYPRAGSTYPGNERADALANLGVDKAMGR